MEQTILNNESGWHENESNFDFSVAGFCRQGTWSDRSGGCPTGGGEGCRALTVRKNK